MASFHTQKALLNSVTPLNRQKNSSLSPAAAAYSCSMATYYIHDSEKTQANRYSCLPPLQARPLLIIQSPSIM